MIKLIVSDFDGTLLPYGETMVSAKVLKNIELLVDQGCFFAVSSGRTYSELKTLLAPVCDKIYFVADDGALTVKNDKIVHKKPFLPQTLKDFFDKAKFKNASFYSFDTVFVTDDHIGQNYGKRIKPVHRQFEINDDVYKISATSFELLNCNNKYRIHFKEGNFAEFVPPYSNKGVALTNLQLHLSVSSFETVAIGDAANDISMMAHANYSISIGNKCNDLVGKCKYNCNSIEEAFDLIKNMKST